MSDRLGNGDGRGASNTPLESRAPTTPQPESERSSSSSHTSGSRERLTSLVCDIADSRPEREHANSNLNLTFRSYRDANADVEIATVRLVFVVLGIAQIMNLLPRAEPEAEAEEEGFGTREDVGAWLARRPWVAEVCRVAVVSHVPREGKYDTLVRYLLSVARIPDNIGRRARALTTVTRAEAFFATLRPRLLAVARGESALARYSPHPGSPHRAWFEKLGIPLVRGTPAVVLHDLFAGCIFRPLRGFTDFTHSHVIMSPDGHGKTGVLLECLRKRYGFYFTCSETDDGGAAWGSADLSNAIRDLDVSESHGGVLFPLTERDGHTDEEASRQNARTTVHRFGRVALARMKILECFLHAMDTAAATRSRSRRGEEEEEEEEARETWMLLQLAPVDLLGEDVFSRLADVYHDADYAALEEETRDTAGRVGILIGLSEKTPFVAVDDGQLAAGRLIERHLERSPGRLRRWNGEQPTPALRCAVMNWGWAGMKLVASSQMGRTVFDVNFGEEGYGDYVVRCRFETAGEVEAYVRRYLPPAYLDSDEGRLLLERMGRWLIGRYGLLAGCVRELLEDGFKDPHSALKAYIFRVASVSI
ncbi:hypothetical protein BXZ70DRAFT_951879 [Cristinia sonorae]|uniref:Uncharacterized protein n=1 Tax=Cristinia sonorae TaxID=1940300 RepID=A0A8K0UIF5_9AGAR|nr:hypothetical protein BXZ70DRAFT_951879 [Cristinia sonorae]